MTSFSNGAGGDPPLPLPTLMQIAAFYWHGTPLPFRPRVRFASAGPLLLHSSESTSVGVRAVEVLGVSVTVAKLNEIIDAICGAPQAERSLVHEGTAAKLKLTLDSRAGLNLAWGQH